MRKSEVTVGRHLYRASFWEETGVDLDTWVIRTIRRPNRFWVDSRVPMRPKHAFLVRKDHTTWVRRTAKHGREWARHISRWDRDSFPVDKPDPKYATTELQALKRLRRELKADQKAPTPDWVKTAEHETEYADTLRAKQVALRTLGRMIKKRTK